MVQPVQWAACQTAVVGANFRKILHTAIPVAAGLALTLHANASVAAVTTEQRVAAHAQSDVTTQAAEIGCTLFNKYNKANPSSATDLGFPVKCQKPNEFNA